MIAQMIERIMLKGIRAYSKKNQVEPSDVSLRIFKKTEEENLQYEFFINFKNPVSVTFKQFIDKKIDIMNIEQISTPVLDQSLNMFSENFSIDFKELSVFLISNNNKKIRLVVYKQGKQVGHFSLEQHLETLEIGV